MSVPSKNLQDLLKFAIKHQKDGNNGDIHANSELDPERKQFLENVLQSMTLDVMEELELAIRILENASSTNEEKINALNVVRDYIDNIDFANSFAKIGGTEILLKCMRDEDVQIRTGAINIIAEMSQNNPFCQENFLRHDLLKVLIDNLKQGNDQVAASSLYALSALMRSYEPATEAFCLSDGVMATLECLNSQCSRVFTKACFLISSLSSQTPAVRDAFLYNNAFEKLFENLDCVNDFEVKTEAVLLAMVSLTESDKFQVNDSLKKRVRDTLKRMVTNIKGLPQCEEMEMYSNKILDKLQ